MNAYNIGEVERVHSMHRKIMMCTKKVYIWRGTDTPIAHGAGLKVNLYRQLVAVCQCDGNTLYSRSFVYRDPSQGH